MMRSFKAGEFHPLVERVTVHRNKSFFEAIFGGIYES
jgi:hypothetical protein